MASNADGSATITCEDGSSATVMPLPGTPGDDGTSCTVEDNLDGTKTISCDDGTSVIVNDGEPGEPGPIGPPGGSSGDVTAIDVIVDGVVVNGPDLTIDFRVEDQDGFPYVDLPASAPRVTLAKLVPGQNGSSSRWVSYIHRVESPGAVGTGDGSDEFQATNARMTTGTFVSHGDGTYSYTFGFDVTNVTTPVPVTWEPSLTHRIAMQVSVSGLPSINTSFDWVPDGGAMFTRDIVETATCNQCHNKLTLHGSRTEVRYCVTCHNPGTTDANSDNTVDFKVMIHKIHRGATLPSVLAGGEYVIWGNSNSEHDYSDIQFPQTFPNCTTCHDPANPNTPDAGNYTSVPTGEACGSCHDNVSFDTGLNHPGGARSNSECAMCHQANNIAATHVDQAVSQAAAFAYRINDITYDPTSGAESLTVSFSVVDPTNGNAPYDLTTDPAFTTGGGVSRLGIVVGWDSADYTNAGSGSSGPGQPIAVNPLGGAATAVGDGTYDMLINVSGTGLPAAGSAVVAIEGHPAGPSPDGGAMTVRVAVPSVVEYVAINDAVAVPRRQVADAATKCDNCHGVLSMHGANRTDNLQVCVICHNSSATDFSRRPADHLASPTLDGKKEESIDFKRMIHGIHGGEKREHALVVYGYGGSANEFAAEDVNFPGILNDCSTCHLDGTNLLPLDPNVIGSTIDTDPAAVTKAATANIGDQSDDGKISPTASVCSACHDTALARAHMEQNGASWDALTSADVETCAICHGEGRDYDVARVHAEAGGGP